MPTERPCALGSATGGSDGNASVKDRVHYSAPWMSAGRISCRWVVKIIWKKS